MMKQRYAAVLSKLGQLTNYERNVRVPYVSQTFDLEQFKSFLDTLGSPQRELKAILIAGTSGKGATGRILTNLLRAGGYSVGFYSSPHVLDIRERIELDGQAIPEGDFVEQAHHLFDCEHFIKGEGKGLRTFFEFLTAMAVLYFQQARPDYCVFEVGVGGRLDATNVFQPVVSIITPVGLDHLHWLGRTRSQIAVEKSGIIHPHSKVISARQAQSVLSVIKEKAATQAVELFVEGVDFRGRLISTSPSGSRFNYQDYKQDLGLKNITLSLAAPFQVQNASIAVKAFTELTSSRLDEQEECIRECLGRIKWPGRVQIISLFDKRQREQRTLVLDGAHNTLGMGQLVRSIKKLFPRQKVASVVGIARDKQYGKMLGQLANITDSWYLTRFSSDRASSPEILAESLPSDSRSTLIAEPGKAVRTALEQTTADTVILATGSLYLVSDVLAFLKTSEQQPEFYQRYEIIRGPGLSC